MANHKHKPHIRCVGYLQHLLEPKIAKQVVTLVIKMIKESGIEFDAIACRGLSSLLIAPIVAMRLNKTLLCIRKEGENSHSNNVVEGDHAARRYLIIDDFIDSGATIKTITATLHGFNPSMRCAGFIAYKRLVPNGYTAWEDAKHNAWWDKESDTRIRRFFSNGYLRDVEEEGGELWKPLSQSPIAETIKLIELPEQSVPQLNNY